MATLGLISKKVILLEILPSRVTSLVFYSLWVGLPASAKLILKIYRLGNYELSQCMRYRSGVGMRL